MASLKVNGVSITNPTVLSNQFNNHFATISPELASNIDSSNSEGYQKYLTGTDKWFQLHPTSTNKVLSLLNRLNKSKAAGLDKISARLIRECTDLICIPIRDIFNQSVSQGIFPDNWKCAKFTPLFKQGALAHAACSLRNYLTIRLRARVFYAQMVNEAQPR